MNNLSSVDQADINQLYRIIDSLLIAVGSSGLLLGIILGVYICQRYDIWLQFKRGGDYCPLCNQEKGQGGTNV